MRPHFITALSLLACLFIFSDATADRITPHPTRLNHLKRVRWGYGCGGNCAFNTEGDSTVALSYNGDKAEVKDNGALSRHMTTPADMTTAVTQWGIVLSGTWKLINNVEVLTLSPERVRCSETENSSDKKTKKMTGCPPIQKEIILLCTRKQVEATHSPSCQDSPDRTFLVEALICSPEGSIKYPGTEFPWTFGIEKKIRTLYIGEPRPITYYVIER